ncbi:hypothetical protein QFC21_001559 [Naganishia friedmannii]|uniref:Uncharacterized protein n=1 Tax=Naganishia friedmannii TaxID=89922 RepID=A0ACC2W4U1_9TREE|nr:hypothetical protein QFC21_001559 [Naganishia friedmannii]
MSPYTFLPGLGSTTTIHLPPASFLPPHTNDASVLLTFTALSTPDADNAGRVEVWTDAGTAGEWRAVPFSSAEDSNSDKSSPLVAYISLPIKETSSSSSSSSSPSFGYTYRIQHDSGDITWLGDMGCNGRVELLPSSSTTQGGEAVQGLWNGDEWLDLTLDNWAGFGVHLDHSDIPHGVFLSESTKDLAFAYIHPSTSAAASAAAAPFATFHPTKTTSLSSTGIAFLPPSPDIYLSTSSGSLKPVIRGEGAAAGAGHAQPAAYASYCGLGFAGGEGDRWKAFRSLFARHQQHGSATTTTTWEYLARFRSAGDEGKKGQQEQEEQGHAVALVCAAPGTGAVPKWVVAYFSGGPREAQEAEAVRWDCSALREGKGEGKIALWDAEERCAILPGIEGEEKNVVSFSTTGKSPFLKTLQIIQLFEMTHAGSSVVFGVLSASGDGTLKEAKGWAYEPEKVKVEEYYVDEQVMAPAPTTTKKAIPDVAPRSADSGVTGSTTSPGSSEHGDETSATSIEEVLEDADDNSLPTLKKQGKTDDERDGYVFVAPAAAREEGEAPMTGDLHEAERGSQAEAEAAEGTNGKEPMPNDADTTTERETSPAAPTEPTVVAAPRKSFFRFLWITLGLFQSLYFRAISWFRGCWGGSDAAPVVGAAETTEEEDEDENEETPLLNKDSAADSDYASTSQRTLPGGYAKSVTTEIPQEIQEPAPRQAEEAPEPAPPAPMETIRVLEQRKIVLPAYIHTRKATAGDVFLLTSLHDVGGLVAEIESKHGDDDANSYPSWMTLDVVQETVASDSDMRLVKVSGMESDSHIRIRLV